MTSWKPVQSGAFFLTILAGCASTPAPRELVTARAAYQHAESGEASRLTPAELHEARVALDSAERAYKEDEDATRDLAYVAERKAQLAEALAGTLSARQASETARRNVKELKAKQLQRAQGELAQASGQLANERQELAMSGQKLAVASQALEREKQARAEAEQRARDALAKLAVAAALAVKEEPRGQVITLPEGVLFEFGKDKLRPTSQDKLGQVAEALKSQEDHKIVIEGHTDSVGTDEANLGLSQRRAKAVRDFLVARGVGAEHITATGVGEARPIADNASPEGRANNRRVEIIVQTVEKR